MTRARDLGDFIADGAAAELVVDTTTLVVDSTNNRVGIGTASPATALDVVGNATITVADNTTQLTLVSTDADASVGPVLDLYRNSASPADNDVTGRIIFSAENDADEKIEYQRIITYMPDVSDGSEDGAFQHYIMKDGTRIQRLEHSPTESVFNQDSADVDFRVESDSDTHALFVEGSSGNVGIGTSSPNAVADLHVADTTDARIWVEATSSDTLELYAGTGVGVFNRSNSHLVLGTNNAERFRISSTGQLGIAGANYGTSGQVLTSGGSGAAPSWADAGGGGTIELTASENLSAGDPVIVNTSGQTAKIATTVGSFTIRSPQDVGSAPVYGGVAAEEGPTTGSHQDSRWIATLFIRAENSYPQLRAFQTSSLTNSTLTSRYNSYVASSSSRAADICWNQDKKEFGYCWAQNNSGMKFAVVRFNSSNSTAYQTTVTINSEQTVGDYSEGSVLWDSQYERYVIFYGRNNKLQYATVSSDGAGNITAHTTNDTNTTGDELRYFRAVSNGAGVIGMNAANSSGTQNQYLYSFAFTGANTIGIQGNAILNSSIVAVGGAGIAYDPDNAKFLASYYDGTTGKVNGATIATSSPYGVTLGSAVTINTNNNQATSNSVVWDKLSGFSAFYNSGSSIGHRPVTLSGNNPTMGSETLSSSASYWTAEKAFDSAATNSSLFGILGIQNNSTQVYPAEYATSTNLTDDNFIGFAKSATSSGAAGDVNVVSSLDTNQSGLTAGSKFYVDQTGSLTTSSGSNQYAGIATAATKLLVKG